MNANEYDKNMNIVGYTIQSIYMTIWWECIDWNAMRREKWMNEEGDTQNITILKQK